MPDLGIGAGLAVMAFWGFIAVAVIAGVWDSIRKRETQHETVRRLIESGQTIDQETLDKLLSLTQSANRPDQDLKITALWLLPVAAGLAIFGLVYAPVKTELLGVAALVGALGVGFLVAAKIAARWYENGNDLTGNR